MTVHLTAKPARFDANAKGINVLQTPLMIEWGIGFGIYPGLAPGLHC